MNLKRLNKLIKRIAFVSQYLKNNGNDPLLMESLIDDRQELRVSFGDYLKSRLFDVYDEYFEDDEILNVEDYIESGVEVYGDEFHKEKMRIRMKSSPLRIEVKDMEGTYCSVLWQAA